MSRRFFRNCGQLALLAAGVWLLAWLSVRALDHEIDAHSASAWAGAYDASEQ